MQPRKYFTSSGEAPTSCGILVTAMRQCRSFLRHTGLAQPGEICARRSSLRGGVGRRTGLLRAGALKPGGELIEPLGTTRWRFYDRGSGGRPCLLSCGRCRIEFAVALLDSPGANMALYRDTDMVRAIAGTRRVKFLPGFTGRQGENALTQPRALRAGFTSRQLACSGSWRPPATSRGNGGLCFCSRSRSGSPREPLIYWHFAGS
jgi:hypothetical protein